MLIICRSPLFFYFKRGTLPENDSDTNNKKKKNPAVTGGVFLLYFILGTPQINVARFSGLFGKQV
jgi:hypothetical protein